MLTRTVTVCCVLAGIIIGLAAEARSQTFRTINDQTVRFSAGNLSVDFWRDNGGAPITVRGNGTVISSAFPGEGYQDVAETRNGNDPTGGGGDGVSEYPIALHTRPDTGVFAYWGREVALSSGEYAVEGPSPHFWSHDTVTPSSDNIIIAGKWEGRENFGIPLVFTRRQSADTTSGAIVFGNHGRFWARQSESVIAEVPKGRIAFKMRIELKDGSPDAFACVHYKKTLSSSVIPPTHGELVTAPGYTLCLNRLGHLEVWATGSRDPVYTTRNTWWIREWLAAQIRERGVHVEIRTHNWSSDLQEIWLMDTFVPNSKPWLLTTFTNQSFINTGPHFGISAYSTSGEVRFSERVICDMGLSKKNTFRLAPNSGLEFDTVWSSASGDLIELYSATQQLFAASAWAQGVHCDQFGWSSGSASAQFLGKPQEMFVGKRANNQRASGLIVQIVRAEVDGKPSSEAYASLQYIPNQLAIIHANALSERLWRGDGGNNEYRFQTIRLTTRLNYRQQ